MNNNNALKLSSLIWPISLNNLKIQNNNTADKGRTNKYKIILENYWLNWNRRLQSQQNDLVTTEIRKNFQAGHCLVLKSSVL